MTQESPDRVQVEQAKKAWDALNERRQQESEKAGRARAAAENMLT